LLHGVDNELTSIQIQSTLIDSTATFVSNSAAGAGIASLMLVLDIRLAISNKGNNFKE
jgi:predicted GNAT family acetyltransferase